MQTEEYAAVIATPLPGGLRLGIRMVQGRVSCVDFLPAEHGLRRPEKEALPLTAALKAYFQNPCMRLNLPLQRQGTAFQQRVWAALRAIPAGEVRTYGQLAEQLHSAPRAVAGACRANPVPIIVPCHRVVSAHGLGGFMGAIQGAPVALKEWLLHHEGAC